VIALEVRGDGCLIKSLRISFVLISYSLLVLYMVNALSEHIPAIKGVISTLNEYEGFKYEMTTNNIPS
jgi:hypothetical protein